MTKMQEWLDNKIQGFRPDPARSQALGDLGAVEQLVKAWRGLDGQESSVFGMASVAALTDVDFERVKANISNALEAWLAHLEADEAATVLAISEGAGMQLRAPDALREQFERNLAEMHVALQAAQAAANGRDASQNEVAAMKTRITALPELVSKPRWELLVARWRKLADFVDGAENFDTHQRLTIKPPMSIEDLARVQANLDRPLPEELLYVASCYSAGVQFGWDFDLSAVAGPQPGLLSEGVGGAPFESAGIFDLTDMPKLLGCRDWEFEGETTEWSTVLPLFQYNSDYVAIDTSSESEQPVVYMSHEEGRMNPVLGESLMGFLERWTSFLLVDLETYCAGSVCLDEQGFGDDAAALNEWCSWWTKLGFVA